MYVEEHGNPVKVSSSAIDSVYFIHKTSHIIIWFNTNPQTPYLYPASQEKYHELMSADSKGRWTANNLLHNDDIPFVKGSMNRINGSMCLNFDNGDTNLELILRQMRAISDKPSWSTNYIIF